MSTVLLVSILKFSFREASGAADGTGFSGRTTFSFFGVSGPSSRSLLGFFLAKLLTFPLLKT